MSDITPPDYSTLIGQVRLLIPDVEQLEDPTNLAQTPEYIFSDPQIQAFLSMNANNIKRAASSAKLALATSEVLINKVIKTYDYATDGAKVGAELRAQAQALRDEADKDDLYEAHDSFIVVKHHPHHGWADDWL